MLINMKSLKKIYQLGTIEVPALRGIDLQIDQNEYVAIMGPSGSRKSTLMNVLGCLDTPTEGHYTLEVVAHDANGDTYAPELTLVGTVEAVTYRDGAAYLRVDGVEIPLGDITAIGERGAFGDD